MADLVLLYCTAPDGETAATIARRLVEERLAACVNIHAPMRSIYEWEGTIEDAAETAFIVKTTAAAAAKARDRILALHPYETPCVLALPVSGAGSAAQFADWVRRGVEA